MLQPRTLTFFRAVLSGWLLLAFPIFADAQRHGGTPSAGEGGLSAYSRPDGVDEKDSLKDFHHAMEVQATGAQVVQFQSLVKSTETVKAKLREYLQPGNEREQPNLLVPQFSLKAWRARAARRKSSWRDSLISRNRG